MRAGESNLRGYWAIVALTAIAALVLAVAINAYWQVRMTRMRLGGSDPLSYFQDVISVGMTERQVREATLPPDHVTYSREVPRGVVVQELRYAVPWAADLTIYVEFDDARVIDVEFDPIYLGERVVLPAAEAERELQR